MTRKDIPRLAIACQGGGAVTAFQSGLLGELMQQVDEEIFRKEGRVVLELPELRDRDEEAGLAAWKSGRLVKYELVGISGTSGGAMNAACVWSACAGGDPKAARHRLDGFWDAMIARVTDFTVTGYWFNALSLLVARQALGLYRTDFNPESWPLAHQALEQFEHLIHAHTGIDGNGQDHAPGLGLYVGATEVRTGNFTVFHRNVERETIRKSETLSGLDRTHCRKLGIAVESRALAASAAIPWVYPAVHLPLNRSEERQLREARDSRLTEEDGTPPGVRADWQSVGEADNHAFYWDGLFSQNPPLWPLLKGAAGGGKPDHILILRANPRIIPHAPKSAEEVDDRRNELEGNLSLEQEIVAIDAINKCVRLAGAALEHEYQQVDVWELDLPWRLHRTLRTLDKMRRDKNFLLGLRREGAALARRFLTRDMRPEKRTR